MTEFKVGDRVRAFTGEVGEVAAVLGDGVSVFLYGSENNTAHSVHFTADQLELVTPEPSVYRLQVPPEPPEHVTRVRPVGKTEPVFRREGKVWVEIGNDYTSWSWDMLAFECRTTGLEPVPAEPQSEYDAAVRWFKTGRPISFDGYGTFDSEWQKHAAVIVRKVLADEPASAGPDIGTVLRELRKELRRDRVQARDELAGGRVDGITTAMHRVTRLIDRHTDEAVRDA